MAASPEGSSLHVLERTDSSISIGYRPSKAVDTDGATVATLTAQTVAARPDGSSINLLERTDSSISIGYRPSKQAVQKWLE